MTTKKRGENAGGAGVRKATIVRNTTETRIELELTIEGGGRYKVSTGIRFFDHMLELFTRHGAFDLELKCDGDLDVDQHHTVEDVGIALGEAFNHALGDKRGILRAGYFVMPMDETLAIAAVDLSGRTAFAVDTKVRTRLVGDLQTELVTDFFEGFARGARGVARGLQPRQATGRDAAVDERPALMRVTVIDYKAGNLTSVLKTLKHLGAEPVVSDSDLSLVESAERIVLPGVGHFAATERLDATGLTGAIRAAIARGVPFLGICVGMQWLYAGSTEAPQQPGLGAFSESCTRFAESTEKVPHVGWNSLEVREGSRLLAGVEPGEFVYFTHSYKGPLTADTAAVTEYIEPFAAAVERGNVMGVQFHPEKSGETGLKILRNFLEMGR
jgi:imidazole glycerol phosphate synthase glutamine amidotransferase subunit